MNKKIFTVTIDTAFEDVIANCASVHRKNDGDTWITDEMIKAYTRLHYSGLAHSIEVWSSGELVGGLYGVSLGSAFFGESMFSRQSNASKVAFSTLVRQLLKWKFTLIDCQITTPHLISLGAREIPRSEFLKMLKSALRKPTKKGKWKLNLC